MMYVRGNNDTDVTEYYVNHLMFAVFRELDGDMGLKLLYCIIVQKAAHYDGCVMTGCDADGVVSENLFKKINNR